MTEHATNEAATPSFPIERAAAALFGAYICGERTRRKISADGLVQGSTRTEEWLQAVERGEIELSDVMLQDIGAMFLANGHLLRVADTASELQRFPLGQLARDLSADLALGTLDGPTSSTAVDHVSPTSIMEAVSRDDRFLVVVPVVFFGAILMLVSRTLAWSLGSTSGETADRWTTQFIDLVDTILLPAILVGALASALSLPSADRLLNRAARALRSSERQRYLGLAAEQFEKNGVRDWQQAQRWRIAPLAPQMIAKHRSGVLDSALRVDFIERIEPVTLAGCVVALAASVIALATHGIEVEDAGPVVVLFTLTLLWWRSRTAADSAAQYCHSKLAGGLGFFDVTVPAEQDLPTP